MIARYRLAAFLLLFLLSSAFAAAQDVTPPAAVSDLNVSFLHVNYAPLQASAGLTWTATGDDGFVGNASVYDLRYSFNEITEANWDSASQAGGEPVPQEPGSLEAFTVTGLLPNTTYYFALRVGDEVPNWSSLSNPVNATTLNPPDVEPPSVPAGLSAVAYSTRIDLSWEPSVDNVGVAGYIIYLGGEEEVGDTPYTSFSHTGLTPSTTYEYRISAYDFSGNPSELSEPLSVTTTAFDATPPPPLTPTPPQPSEGAEEGGDNAPGAGEGGGEGGESGAGGGGRRASPAPLGTIEATPLAGVPSELPPGATPFPTYGGYESISPFAGEAPPIEAPFSTEIAIAAVILLAAGCLTVLTYLLKRSRTAGGGSRSAGEERQARERNKKLINSR